MADPHACPPPGNLEAQCLVSIFIGAALAILVVFIQNWLPFAASWIAYALPVVLAVSLVLSVRLLRCGQATIPPMLGTLGVIFVAGGGIFDMSATVIHSPKLEDEGNLIARHLLDSGHSVAFLYQYAVISQTLLLVFTCTVWLGLLRHRGILINLMKNQASFYDFLTAMMGGQKRPPSRWRFLKSIIDLPRFYEVFWLIAVLLVATAADRWYLGFEWFYGYASYRSLVLGTAITSALVGYVFWLWCASRQAKACEIAMDQSDQPSAGIGEVELATCGGA